MNVEIKMSKEKMQQLVLDGAERCETIEAGLDEIRREIDALSAIPEAARRLGMVGYLETQEMRSELQSIAGGAAKLRARIFKFHRRATAVAQEFDVDLPQPRDGGGGR